MRGYTDHITLSREDAVAAMLHACTFSPISERSERVSIAQAFGRVLAEDVVSRVQVPGALTCNLDSIAVHWSAFEGLSDGELPDTSKWVRGEDWQFANTGVAMPEGFDTAIAIEHVCVAEDEQSVKIDAAPSKRFAGTRAAGSKLKVGDLLAKAGQLVTPDVAARIAGGNVASVSVVRKPRVAFIPTGDELVVPGSAHVPANKNIETNSLLARGKVQQWGGEFLPFDVVPDQPALIEDAVRAAVRQADIVVLNAGSSKGSADWNIEQLEDLGHVICHETNHGPGHHSSYALVDGTPVVGISGPPAGASFTMNFYLRPVMRAFLGLEPEVPRIPAKLVEPFPAGGPGHKGPGKPKGEDRPREATGKNDTFYAIRFVNVETLPDGTIAAVPVKGPRGSREQEAANAYYMMPTGGGAVPPAAGDVIEVELR